MVYQHRTYKHVEPEPSREAQQPEELLTVREVAKRLRVDDTTVRRWIKSGVLEAVTLPHLNTRQSYRVKKSTLNAILAGNSAEVRRNVGRAS